MGIYRHLLSLRDQRIYAAVAGKTHLDAGHELEVEPLEISPADQALWLEWDGRIRAARLDGPGGHIIFESYRDWLVEQRLARKQKGIWSGADATGEFPAGHPDEEIIVGFRAWQSRHISCLAFSPSPLRGEGWGGGEIVGNHAKLSPSHQGRGSYDDLNFVRYFRDITLGHLQGLVE